MAKNTDRGKNLNKKTASKINMRSTKQGTTYLNSISQQKYISIFYKLILIAILVIVFYPPFQRGLFFEDDYIKAELFVFIVFAAYCVYKLMKKDKLVLSTPLDYASFAFVIVYLISIIASVGLNLAVEEWLKYCMYFAIFFMLTDLVAEFKNRIKILWAIIISAVGVCIIGIDAIAGNNIVTALNNIFNRYYLLMDKSIPEKGKFFGLLFGGRVSSTLQYPNTLASFLIAAFFVAIGLTLLSESKLLRMLSLTSSALYFLALIFTESRGAFLIFPFIIILLTVVLPKGIRAKGLIYIAVPLIASIPGIIKISELRELYSEGSTAIWLWVLISIVSCLIISFLSEFAIPFFEGISWKKLICAAGGIFVVVCVGLVIAVIAREPLVITFPGESQEVNKSYMRSVILQPDKEYRMTFNVSGKNNQEKETEYAVSVFSNSEKEILKESPNLLNSISGKVKSETISKELDFTVPADSKIMYIYLYNSTKGTEIIFDKCLVTDVETGKVAADIPLKYKYIPEMIQSRLQDLQVNKSSIERMVFYKNGLAMFGDHWLIGAGGGAWSLLYFSYQSYLYYSTQAHNYFLQTAVETGIIGIFALLFLFFSIVFMFIRQRYNKNVNNDKTLLLQTILFTILAFLFFHAAIDFDFSFPAMLLLVWEILALYNAGAKELAEQTEGYKLPILKEVKFSSAVVLVITFVFIIRTAMVISAVDVSKKGIKAANSQDYDLALKSFEEAAGLNPLKAEYKINYSNVVVQKGKITADELAKANRNISEAEKLSKYDVTLLPVVGKYYFSIENIQKSIDILENAVKLRPFRAEEWEQLTGACNSAWVHYLQKNNKEQAMAMADRALKTISWATEVNKKNMNPFVFNSKTSQYLEQFTYYKDKQNDKNLTGTETIAFYSLPYMDIDGNSMPDQWNATPSKDYILKAENKMLRVDKMTTAQDSFIQSRLLALNPNTQYRVELNLENQNGQTGIRYLVSGVNAQAENFEFANGANFAEFTTPEKVENNSLMLYFDKGCVIKSLSIIEMKGKG